MPHTDMSIPALLQERATMQGDATAYTFMDGAVLGTGHPETLAWAQVYRRALVVAEELRRYGSTGDRAAILAPQGLDYIVAFFGALQAGFIAVPLPVPQFGVRDHRVASALQDSAPAVLLTTSSAVAEVNKYANAPGGRSARRLPTALTEMTYSTPRLFKAQMLARTGISVGLRRCPRP